MCVIAIADESQRLTEDIIRKCDIANSDGIGIAWQKSKEILSYKKDVKIDEAISLAATLPLPYVYHFRLATVGGNVSELCHPFVVSKKSPVAIQGETNEMLLFHNGHLNAWYQMAKKCDINLEGPVSDSRMVASLVAWTGYKILNLLDGKYALLASNGVHTFGDGWHKSYGCIFSNLLWQYREYGCRSIGKTTFYGDDGDEYERYSNYLERVSRGVYVPEIIT